MHIDIMNTCKNICITKRFYPEYKGIHLGHVVLEVFCRSGGHF